MIDSPLAQGPVRTFCTFRAQGRLYGIDVRHVREVSTQSAVTAVPQAPAIIRGLSNLRSQIFLVLDLRAALGMAPVECTPDSRLVVLHAAVAENLGLLVDSGGEIVRVPADQIEETSLAVADSKEAPAKERGSSVVAVCKLKDELMMIIDPSRLVAASEQAIR
jgi:purine-binding chemotaxis protein CheW